MIPRNMCVLCAHYDGPDDEGLKACPAFPRGIPPEIMYDGFDHRQPFDGDNGIMFTPDDGVTPERVELLVRANLMGPGDPPQGGSAVA